MTFDIVINNGFLFVTAMLFIFGAIAYSIGQVGR